MQVWDVLLTTVVVAVTAWPLLAEHPLLRMLAWMLGLPAIGGSIWLALLPPEEPARPLPEPAEKEGFVSADSCRSCHPGYYASWHRTYHRTMTQAATPEAVIPAFDGVTLSSRGRVYHLERRGDEFWVDMVDPAAEVQAFLDGVDLAGNPDAPRARRRIAMTTGSHKHQTYWVQNPNGTLIQFPWVYHINTDRWVYRIDSFLRPPTDAQTFNIWNLTCIDCHATGGQPRVSGATQTMFSAGELGISCEACHGPGAEHVEVNRNPGRRLSYHLQGAADPTIVNPQRCSAETASQICGRCHSVAVHRNEAKWQIAGSPYRAGGDNFGEMRQVLRYEEVVRQPQSGGESDNTDSLFWRDGTIRTGGREYNGLIESACYTQGSGKRQLSCLSCHSMHYSDPNDQLAAGMQGDRACTQCHAEPQYTERVKEHTHHPAASSGSQCYNCHMPHTSYALFSAIRSHRIQSPNAANTVATGRPNACNLCHLDRPLAWTAAHLSEWYGAPSVTLDDDDRDVSAAVLWMLQGDAAQRAITAWNAGWPDAKRAAGEDWLAPFLAELLVDPYSAVRYIAAESLRKLPGYAGFDYDFDAPPERREAARREALERWKLREIRNRPPALLMDEHGRLDRSRIEQLLDKRDDRPVVILE